MLLEDKPFHLKANTNGPQLKGVRGEAWARETSLHRVKKGLKITEWILGFRAKMETKSWEMSSSLSRVRVEVSVSEALFPPLHSSASFMKISSHQVDCKPTADALFPLVPFSFEAGRYSWWMLTRFQVLSSTEQQLRCLSSRLCVHTSIY